MAKTYTRRKKGFSLVLFLISCFAILILAKDAFVSMLADFALATLYPKKEGCSHGYLKAKWEGKTLCVYGAEIIIADEDLLIEKVELVLGIKPHLYVIRPQWMKKSESVAQNQHSILPLLTSKFLRVDVVEGRYLALDKTQVLFSLESFDSDKPTSRMSCYTKWEMNEAPFLEALFSVHDEGARIEVDSKSATTNDLFAIAQIFMPKKSLKVEHLCGNWTGNFSLDLNRSWSVIAANGSISGQEFTFSSPFAGWRVEGSELDLRFTLHPSKEQASWLQRLEADAAISQGRLYLKSDEKEYRMHELAGQLSWNREADPKFYLEGTLDIGEKSERVVLEGMGRFEDMTSFHLMTQFLLGDKAVPVAAGQASIRTEDVTRLHLDVDLERMDLPFLKCLLPAFGYQEQRNLIPGSGSVKLKSHFLYEKNRLCEINLFSSSLETPHFDAHQGVKMENVMMSAEGRWEKNSDDEWIAKRVKIFLESKEMKLSVMKPFLLEGLSGEFLIEDGQIEQSSLKTSLSNIPLEVVASGSWRRPIFRVFAAGTLDLFATAFPELRIQTQSDDLIEVSCECIPEGPGYKVATEILLGSQGRIEVQFTWEKDEIKKGSLKATHMPLSSLQGSLDLNATFDVLDGAFAIGSCSSEIRLSNDMHISLATNAMQLDSAKSEVHADIETILSMHGNPMVHSVGKLNLLANKGSVEFVSSQCEILNHRIDKAHLQFSDGRLNLEELMWNDCKLSANIVPKGSAFCIKYDFVKAGFKSYGSATIDVQKGEAEAICGLEFSLAGQPIFLKAQSPLKCRFDNLGAYVLESGNWEEPTTHSSFKFSKIDQNGCVGANFKIASAFVKKFYPTIATPSDGLEGTLKVLKNGAKYEITGTLNDGKYGLEGFSHEFRSLQWRLANGNLLAGAKMKIGERDATGTLQFDMPSRLGLIKVQEVGDDSSLNTLVRFDEKSIPQVQKITGEAFGFKADLKNNGKNALVGKIDFDFAEISRVLPLGAKTSLGKLKLGKGFSFEGEISCASLADLSGRGAIRGKDCHVLGATLKHLEAPLTFKLGSVQFKNIIINDKSVSSSIPRLNLEKIAAATWVFQCPLLQIKDLVPSRLFGEKEKPFIVRNLTLSDLKGELGRLSDAQGKCILHFTNAWKKETTILDLPRNFLKDLGLEPSLFVPVQGELVGHFENNRLLFTELKGAFSEERRTRFALSNSGEGSYVDFDGKLHIDLIMRQSVVLKVAETMMLSIRGSLEKPRYVLVP
jgi:hypothetical protein